jgi:hypothetical protein
MVGRREEVEMRNIFSLLMCCPHLGKEQLGVYTASAGADLIFVRAGATRQILKEVTAPSVDTQVASELRLN